MAEPLPPDDLAGVMVGVGILLRVGMLTAAAVLLVGGVVFLARHAGEKQADCYRHLRRGPDRQAHPPNEELSRPASIYQAVRKGSGRALIQLALVLLIATPILRVAFTAAAFAWRRDFAYVLVPLIVLAVLLAGLLTGQAG